MDYYKVGKHSYFVDCKDRAEYNDDVTAAINSSNHIVRYVPKYSFVKHDTEISDKNSYVVRFCSEWYNVKFKSGYDQDDYIIDQDSRIVKSINQVLNGEYKKAYAWLQNMKMMDITQDPPIYGSGYRFEFANKYNAVEFCERVLKYFHASQQDDVAQCFADYRNAIKESDEVLDQIIESNNFQEGSILDSMKKIKELSDKIKKELK
tara:strand:+ start:674 stop:1291 length:618 start_codon:yes stop_codon:yes gene_type:complete